MYACEFDFKWDHHIEQVSANAAPKLTFTKRNLWGAPAECKKLACVALVRSGLECTSIMGKRGQIGEGPTTGHDWLSSYSRTTSVTSLLEQLRLESANWALHPEASFHVQDPPWSCGGANVRPRSILPLQIRGS